MSTRPSAQPRRRWLHKSHLVQTIIAFFMALSGTIAYGHALGPMGVEPLGWQNEQISQVVGGGRPSYTHPRDVKIEGRSCVSGTLLNFNVRDDYAFDIDETVELELEFYVAEAGKVTLTYDRNDVAPPSGSSVEELSAALAVRDILLSPGGSNHRKRHSGHITNWG